MLPLPPAPLNTVIINFCGPFPTGEHMYLLVVIEANSIFPQAHVAQSTSTAVIMPKLDQVFATHGIAAVVRSDNGTPVTRMALHTKGSLRFGHKQPKKLKT